MTVAPAFRASSAMRRELASMLESSMTPLTASCRAPPSLVKSFWYSIRTTAVFAGSTSMVASRRWGGGSNVAPPGVGGWEEPVLLRRDRGGQRFGSAGEDLADRVGDLVRLTLLVAHVFTVTVTVGPGTVIVTGGPNTVVVGPVTLWTTVVTVV